MDCFSACGVFFLASSLLLDFIAATVTSWFTFKTKTDQSLLLQWSGVYQTCRHGSACTVDLWERPVGGKIVFFLLIFSLVVLSISLGFVVKAEHKSKKIFYFCSGCFSLSGGLTVAAATTLYTFSIEWRLDHPTYTGVPSFGACYFIAWASVFSSLLGGIILISQQWRDKKRVLPLTSHRINNHIRLQRHQVLCKRRETSE